MVDNEELNRFGEWFEKEDREIQKEWKLSPCRECLFSNITREGLIKKCNTCKYKEYLKKRNDKQMQEELCRKVWGNNWQEVLKKECQIKKIVKSAKNNLKL